MRELFEAIAFVICLFTVIITLFVGTVLLIDKQNHPTEMKQVQTLRNSYNESNSEELLPMVVETNQNIIYYKDCNQSWLDMFVDDDWDRVSLIEIKKHHLGLVK